MCLCFLFVLVCVFLCMLKLRENCTNRTEYNNSFQEKKGWKSHLPHHSIEREPKPTHRINIFGRQELSQILFKPIENMELRVVESVVGGGILTWLNCNPSVCDRIT